MAPRRAEEIPLKRIAASGCRLPERLPPGEILTDITQNQWMLGDSIGCGGFGDIYLASNDTTKPVGQDAKYVIKIEPHNNGPLFVEMNFYIRVARKHKIESWCKSQGMRRRGIPTYEGSGSHTYQGQRYRFLVIPRYGIDVGKVFLGHGRKLPAKLVYSLAVQMLDALEYVHSHGYAHADVKGSNILFELNGRSVGAEHPQAYLVDYGLAYRFQTRSGVHKPFVHDERRAHEGTLEFTSRDAHHGTHSRRGDLETLGYNLLQWLCGRLPWEKAEGGMPAVVNPEEIHAQKEILLTDVPLFMRECFPHKKKPPAVITEYMEYIADLKFETRPNYSYLRCLFARGITRDGPMASLPFIKRSSNENLSFAKLDKRPYLRERRPCKPVNGEARMTRNTQPITPRKEFSWEAVLARHPDKLAKISVQPPASPLTPPPSPPPPSLPTYAMLQVIQKMKDRQMGIVKHKMSLKSQDNDLKPKWMTPAMEEVARIRKKTAQLPIEISNFISSPCFSPRLTRSRSAQLKRLTSTAAAKKVRNCHSRETELVKIKKGKNLDLNKN
ncbi:serine/threonine-protein kinase VRK1 [Cephus cinctus]|uniref:non-specific serine/threonine protein kinase n=1 Tax=Cephus cinctus TaxID=211228 RepID=A0AAJ7BUC2_CEPCN|nr:serine/threonine-protein kinase VRK1 [Cephus cinctus]XP_015594592.1 serine/threonine-protein kinase VRK1 [Cephus cinctus]XP_015594593.1 serine/threonine-protein kinase VRK1 [Cephus cinctus]